MTNTMAPVSPYKCATIVNGWLTKAGVDKKLPPQMFYTYASADKQYIKSHKDSEGKIKVNIEDLKTWFDKYLNKLQGNKVEVTNTEAEVDENQLELDLETADVQHAEDEVEV